MVLKTVKSALAVFFVTTLASLAYIPAYSYSLQKKPSKLLWEQSELVIIGEAIRNSKTNSDFGTRFVVVDVKAVLKGQRKARVDIWTETTISEQDLDCCEIGKEYIFFLESTPDGRFLSVNGRFGVVPLPR